MLTPASTAPPEWGAGPGLFAQDAQPCSSPPRLLPANETLLDVCAEALCGYHNYITLLSAREDGRSAAKAQAAAPEPGHGRLNAADPLGPAARWRDPPGLSTGVTRATTAPPGNTLLAPFHLVLLRLSFRRDGGERGPNTDGTRTERPTAGLTFRLRDVAPRHAE
ncbi:hypothetical protein AAFF_G00058720 [Aldrovandia affinis]|uniref:Uncharacterized protein n=1 Tax=Aldrovandia affinis TaxID=143900 RepID=A0AAD7S0E3_9TELE|nr:hypothetical protein AAFF_G00058720 [Aldrovandia affinis]